MKRVDLRVMVIAMSVLTCTGVIAMKLQNTNVSNHSSDLQLNCSDKQLTLGHNRDSEFSKDECGEHFPFLFFSKLNINTATRNQLLAIKGIGPKSVDKIINYRNKHDGISSPKDLLNIAGFGPITINKLSQHIKYQ